ncbi:MAG: Crp/Fnr family transcriptional regulator [Chloroflexota bacterium]|nr:Crp/Fnr family transcriptional regulator [Chloroflexota bacterium]
MSMLPDALRARANQDIDTFLRQVPIFARLPEGRRAEVAAGLEQRHFTRHEVIASQGAPLNSVFFVKSGIVSQARRSSITGDVDILAYLRHGEMIGEVEMLTGLGSVAGSTATATTEVDLLVMKRQDCLQLLENDAGAALELSRGLAQRLAVANARLSNNNGLDNRVWLVTGGPGSGVTTLGLAMSTALASSTQEPTVYAEYPDSTRLAAGMEHVGDAELFKHPSGFDVYLPSIERETLPAVRTAQFTDYLTRNYANIVVGLTGEISADLAYLFERVDQVVTVTTPDATGKAYLIELSGRLRTAVQSERTVVYTVVNRPGVEYSGMPTPEYADFNIAFVPKIAELIEQALASSPAFAGHAATLADRLRRTNQIGLYIPTTMDVDQKLDTSGQVKRTLDFLGDLFGGATSDEAQGVWKSDESGLVGETVYIVTSFVTRADLDRHLPHIVDYLEGLKLELKQEAMAMEINEKLMLI